RIGIGERRLRGPCLRPRRRGRHRRRGGGRLRRPRVRPGRGEGRLRAPSLVRGGGDIRFGGDRGGTGVPGIVRGAVELRLLRGQRHLRARGDVGVLAAEVLIVRVLVTGGVGPFLPRRPGQRPV